MQKVVHSCVTSLALLLKFPVPPCRGRKVYEPPRYMTVAQAAAQLLEAVSSRGTAGTSLIHQGQNPLQQYPITQAKESETRPSMELTCPEYLKVQNIPISHVCTLHYIPDSTNSETVFSFLKEEVQHSSYRTTSESRRVSTLKLVSWSSEEWPYE